MDNIQKKLVALLSASINEKVDNDVEIAKEEYKLIFKEALNHGSDLIIYKEISQTIASDSYYEKLYQSWKKKYYIYSLSEKTKYSIVGKIVEIFNENNIEYLFLKGFVLKELYPEKCVRIMSDVDILVHPDKLDDAKECLLKLGYYLSPEDDSDCNIALLHKKYIPIELHHHLVQADRYPDMRLINDEIWDKPVVFDYRGTEIVVPNINQHFIYILLHLKKHLIVTGFGLRQLVDVALFVDYYKDELDFDFIIPMIKKYNSERFMHYILGICHEFLDLDISDIPLNEEMIDKTYIDKLINHVFYSGLYGKKNQDNIIDSIYSDYLKDYKFSEKNIFNYVHILFPPFGRIKRSYPILEKIPVLLPIIWVYRLFRNIVMRDDVMFMKKLAFFSSKNKKYSSKLELIYFFNDENKK